MTSNGLIPGAYERNRLTHRQNGSMGPASASADSPHGSSSMDAATIAERQKEGGGGPSQRRRTREAHPRLAVRLYSRLAQFVGLG